ncbi:MAG: hypothetical protein ACOH15_09710 [Acetobacterium sp.]
MNVIMLVIVAVIVVPGYFLIKRLSATIYTENSKMEDETEKYYGFDRLEKQREEKVKLENEEPEKNEINDKNSIKIEDDKENIASESLKKEA